MPLRACLQALTTGLAVLSLSCYHTAVSMSSTKSAALPAQCLEAPAVLI